jgi:hypothetical protein
VSAAGFAFILPLTINTFGALRGFAGTWLVGLLQALEGNSRPGYFVMSMSLILAGGIVFRLRTPKPASRL